VAKKIGRLSAIRDNRGLTMMIARYQIPGIIGVILCGAILLLVRFTTWFDDLNPNWFYVIFITILLVSSYFGWKRKRSSN
jgi:hypothetical protein